MVNKYFLTNSPSQTKKLGESLANEILKTITGKKAIVLGLSGELGSGKTTFLQGFARGLGIKHKILSPTFIIMRRLEVKPPHACGGLTSAKTTKNFYHIDCYRIEKPKEILDLGFKKIIAGSKNIVAIEWAEKIKDIVPQNTIWINFNLISKNIRKIEIKCTG